MRSEKVNLRPGRNLVILKYLSGKGRHLQKQFLSKSSLLFNIWLNRIPPLNRSTGEGGGREKRRTRVLILKGLEGEEKRSN